MNLFAAAFIEKVGHQVVPQTEEGTAGRISSGVNTIGAGDALEVGSGHYGCEREGGQDLCEGHRANGSRAAQEE